MIRHLRRLTRAVPGLAPGAAALAVYAEARDRDATLKPRAAAETGFEGVACVDDAARAVVLYCALWERYRLPWARAAAEELLAFLLAMQAPDGSFYNFVLDWDGQPNHAGRTSRSGRAGLAWTVRAAHALAVAVAALGDDRSAAAYTRTLPHLDALTPHLDLRAVALLGTLEYRRASGERAAGDRTRLWSGELVANRIGSVIPDMVGLMRVHFWGHLQEAALARAGLALGRDDFIAAARQSAEAILVPAAAAGFRRPHVNPFDVSCTVLGLDAVCRATGEARYGQLADAARAWYAGRNPAGQPVYNRAAGLVHDGIDHGRVNANAGAEASIEAGLALLDTLPRVLPGDTGEDIFTLTAIPIAAAVPRLSRAAPTG